MKNPNSKRGVGAFPVTSTATLASPVDATGCPAPTRQNERRYYWSPLSHSVERVIVRKGRIEHG